MADDTNDWECTTHESNGGPVCFYCSAPLTEDQREAEAWQRATPPDRRPIFTVIGRTCTAHVRSDAERGGWLAYCPTHGRITTRDTIGAADAAATDHVALRDRVAALPQR